MTPMKVAPVIEIVSVPNSIELQHRIVVPANTMQPFRFSLDKGQRLSGFYNKIEQGSDAGCQAILTAFQPVEGPSPGPVLAHAANCGAGQRVLPHSDTGQSGSVNLDPKPADYFGSFYWTDGKPHTLIIAYGNGGVAAA